MPRNLGPALRRRDQAPAEAPPPPPAASTAKQNIIFSLNIAHEETMHMYRDCTGLAGISRRISRKDKTFLIFVKSHN